MANELKAKLKELEKRVVALGLAKLESLVKVDENNVTIKKHELMQTEEQVKLAHRIRSLFKNEVVPE